MNELKERLESNLITKTFNISGMPESIWREVDEYCKSKYGDSRWVMLSDLVRKDKEDFKYQLLLSRIEENSQRIEEVKNKSEPSSVQRFKTFGV